MDSNFYLGCSNFFQGGQDLFLGWSTIHINLKFKNFKVLKKKKSIQGGHVTTQVTCRAAGTYNFSFSFVSQEGHY